MCGDATNYHHIKKLLNGNLIDLYITDPPYNVSYEGKTLEKMTIMNDKMNNDDFRLFLRKSFANINQYLKEGSTFYIFHADSEGYNFRGACNDVLWKIRQCLIWNKNTFILGRQDYHWKHEPILYGWKEGAAHNWYGDRSQNTVLDYEKPNRNELHPTMKPTELYIYLMKNSSKKGDIVLDNFAGSGTVIIASEYTGRKGYAMELDPIYCNVIIQRWQQLTGKKAIKVEHSIST
jgi:site-specific DNA-methyltransferase (adenine-specific)